MKTEIQVVDAASGEFIAYLLCAYIPRTGDCLNIVVPNDPSMVEEFEVTKVTFHATARGEDYKVDYVCVWIDTSWKQTKE